MAHSIATEERGRRILAVTLPVIALILVGWALKATYFVTMPLAFAFFLAVLVHPIKAWVQGHVPDRLDWLGIVAAMLAVIAVLAAIGGLIWLSVEIVGGKAPQYADQLRSYWDSIVQWARRNNLPVPQDVAQGGGLASMISGWVGGLLWSFWYALAILALIFFFCLLMLVETSVWRKKSRTAFRATRTEAIIGTVEVVAHKVRWYLLGLTAICLTSGVVAWLWFLVLGIDFAFVWGLITFLFNYVPNVGSIVSVLLATAFVLIQKGWLWALIALAGRAVSEQVIGNYLQPIVQGRILDISPLVVLVSVIFWSWVWGIAGALLAVPLTATIIIVCAHVPALRPVALLLSRGGDEDALEKQQAR